MSDLTTMDDAGLAARVAAGDDAAVGVLYDRYSTPAYSLALRLAGDPQRAAELVQRAFGRVWADAQRFNAETSRFSTWLFSLVNYLALTPVPAVAAARPPAPARSRTITGPLRPVPVRVTCRHD